MSVIKLTEENLNKIAAEAADFLRHGRAVIVPTDTLYGLAVDALNEDAVARFFSLKKRPANKPTPLFVADIQAAKDLAYIDKKQEKILNKPWPGPFTFVLEKRAKVSERLSAGTNTIGLRAPDNAFIKKLLREFVGPITGSSANISGMPAEENLEKIIAQFKKCSVVPDFIVDAGPVTEKEPSTVVDITRPENPRILRMNKKGITKIQEVFDTIK